MHECIECLRNPSPEAPQNLVLEVVEIQDSVGFRNNFCPAQKIILTFPHCCGMPFQAVACVSERLVRDDVGQAQDQIADEKVKNDRKLNAENARPDEDVRVGLHLAEENAKPPPRFARCPFADESAEVAEESPCCSAEVEDADEVVGDRGELCVESRDGGREGA